MDTIKNKIKGTRDEWKDWKDTKKNIEAKMPIRNKIVWKCGFIPAAICMLATGKSHVKNIILVAVASFASYAAGMHDADWISDYRYGHGYFDPTIYPEKSE